MLKQMWPIKHRPPTIKDYVFQNSEMEERVKKWITEKSIPNMMFLGHHGTGKTTLAYILKNELNISDEDFLALNASDKNSVDDMRGEIKSFIEKMSFGDFKIVFFDEFDNVSTEAQKILRGYSENPLYSKSVRFIITANYPKKIIEPLHSRFEQYSFSSINKDEALERLVNIIDEENIVIPDLSILDAYVDAAYPDLRKIISLVEQNVKDGELLPLTSGKEIVSDYRLHILSFLERGDYLSIRELVCKNIDGDEWIELYRFLYDNIENVNRYKNPQKWKDAIKNIAYHLDRHTVSADPEINFTALIIKLTEI